MESALVDFLGFAAIWGALSPLLISLVKNVGKKWTTTAKKWAAILFSAVGAVIGYGITAGWTGINLVDWSEFWVPLLGAFGAIYPIAYVSYQGFWKGTAINTKLAAVGTSIRTSE